MTKVIFEVDNNNSIFECSDCGHQYVNNIENEKLNFNEKCNDCLNIEPLNQNDFKAIVLTSVGSIINPSTKKPEQYATFICSNCNNVFFNKVNHMQRTQKDSCEKCILINKKEIRSRLKMIWISIQHRINSDKKEKAYVYKNKNITMCDEWLNDYEQFKKWSLNNGYSEITYIDRKDNDKSYTPDNCRWTTALIQSQNTRKIRSTNTSGYRGVDFLKRTKKWRAQISNNYKKHTLGTFNTKEEAALAYDKFVLDNQTNHTMNFSYNNLN